MSRVAILGPTRHTLAWLIHTTGLECTAICIGHMSHPVINVSATRAILQETDRALYIHYRFLTIVATVWRWTLWVPCHTSLVLTVSSRLRIVWVLIFVSSRPVPLSPLRNLQSFSSTIGTVRMGFHLISYVIAISF